MNSQTAKKQRLQVTYPHLYPIDRTLHNPPFSTGNPWFTGSVDCTSLPLRMQQIPDLKNKSNQLAGQSTRAALSLFLSSRLSFSTCRHRCSDLPPPNERIARPSLLRQHSRCPSPFCTAQNENPHAACDTAALSEITPLFSHTTHDSCITNAMPLI